MTDRVDFVIHWLWTLTYGILAISGVAMIGARYGWVLNYDIALADYLHRVTAAIWTVLFMVAIFVEIYHIYKQNKKYSLWLIVGTKDYQLFTFFSSIVFIVTGVYIWSMHLGDSMQFTFSLWVHEVLTFFGLGSIIWHIYDKSHSLQ